MVDPKAIPQEHMGSLAGMYAHAGFMYGTELLELSERKQRKVRRWLVKHYGGVIWELPEAVRGCFDPAVEDGEVLTFLAACHERMEQIFREREQELEQLLADLDGETASAIRSLVDRDDWRPPRRTGSCWELTVDEGGAFRRTLILQDVEGEATTEAEYLEEPLTIRRDGGGYEVRGRLIDREQELWLRFSHASVRVERFDPVDALVYWDDPWDWLGWTAGTILEKGEKLGQQYLEAERDILPLLKELEAYHAGSDGSFPLLADLAVRHGQDKLSDLLRTPGKWSRRGHRIRARLFDQRCQPMWREIFQKIRQSQAGYPSGAQAVCDPEVLDKTRAEVQAFMTEQGFSGQYPEFWKRGDVPGVHLVMSYDQSYTVFAEKDASFFVRCMEVCDDKDLPVVHFLCGTAFRRKRMPEADLWSCLFNAKGRRLFRWVHAREHWQMPDGADSIQQSAAVAVKKVQLRRLTRQERKRYRDRQLPGWGLFLWMLLFCGGLFGVVYTLGMMLVGAVIGVLVGQPEQILPMLMEIPWGYFLMAAWLLFGTAMGLITVLAERNR